MRYAARRTDGRTNSQTVSFSTMMTHINCILRGYFALQFNIKAKCLLFFLRPKHQQNPSRLSIQDEVQMVFYKSSYSGSKSTLSEGNSKILEILKYIFVLKNRRKISITQWVTNLKVLCQNIRKSISFIYSGRDVDRWWFQINFFYTKFNQFCFIYFLNYIFFKFRNNS